MNKENMPILIYISFSFAENNKKYCKFVDDN